MKVRSSVKPICEKCKVIKRKGSIRIICENPKDVYKRQRYIKRGGKVWIKIFPEKPVTHKPMGVRMGKGKGALEYWVAVVKPGRVLFEISGVPEDCLLYTS